MVCTPRHMGLRLGMRQVASSVLTPSGRISLGRLSVTMLKHKTDEFRAAPMEQSASNVRAAMVDMWAAIGSINLSVIHRTE